MLALNIGASQITLAEFKIASGQAPVLLQYGTAPLGMDPDTEADPSGFIIAALRDLAKAKGIHPAPLALTISGQSVFPRFVKLPAVSKEKMREMVRYEAEQNAPFPVDEIVWDYQLVGDTTEGEQNAMIVAARTENVISMTSCVAAAGFDPEIVDVAPLSLYNTLRFNYPELDGCTMALDIGSRSTNLVFVEEGKVFYRSIPVAGNTITQEIAKTLGVSFMEAEKIKREHGFVALGGNFASDDELAERVSKVIRNVVTRLHAEVNRSINFYRSQQGGSVPSRVFLTGGSAILAHMDTFFREKLKVDVDFLNPFVRVSIGDQVDPERVGEDFYELGEVVGLAIRKSEEGFVGINLMPPNLVEKKTFRKRLPFLGAAAVALIGASVLFWVTGTLKCAFIEEQAAVAGKTLEKFNGPQSQMAREQGDYEKILQNVDKFRSLISKRDIITRRISDLRSSLVDGMWLTSVVPVAESDGTVFKLEITGRGFIDRLQGIEKQTFESSKKRRTAVEIFRDNLVSKPSFSEDVKITQERDDIPGLKGKVREFKLEVGIDEACRLRKAGN